MGKGIARVKFLWMCAEYQYDFLMAIITNLAPFCDSQLEIPILLVNIYGVLNTGILAIVDRKQYLRGLLYKTILFKMYVMYPIISFNVTIGLLGYGFWILLVPFYALLGLILTWFVLLFVTGAANDLDFGDVFLEDRGAESTADLREEQENRRIFIERAEEDFLAKVVMDEQDVRLEMRVIACKFIFNIVIVFLRFATFFGSQAPFEPNVVAALILMSAVCQIILMLFSLVSFLNRYKFPFYILFYFPIYLDIGITVGFMSWVQQELSEKYALSGGTKGFMIISMVSMQSILLIALYVAFLIKKSENYLAAFKAVVASIFKSPFSFIVFLTNFIFVIVDVVLIFFLLIVFTSQIQQGTEAKDSFCEFIAS
eukprot:TRINITY_DN17311_c0_g1_i1.p1 TRINITY_DN17311_c0_g1~~TRINITY_DN17311_c0_g1_i1.p1  ORF type:complete len:370 (-),score=93.75 TRINITY_DN17311_c0_g1_i1:55-1164(-)